MHEHVFYSVVYARHLAKFGLSSDLVQSVPCRDSGGLNTAVAKKPGTA